MTAINAANTMLQRGKSRPAMLSPLPGVDILDKTAAQAPDCPCVAAIQCRTAMAPVTHAHTCSVVDAAAPTRSFATDTYSNACDASCLQPCTRPRHVVEQLCADCVVSAPEPGSGAGPPPARGDDQLFCGVERVMSWSLSYTNVPPVSERVLHCEPASRTSIVSGKARVCTALSPASDDGNW